MKTYTHPQETWSAAECLRRSRQVNRDGMGTVGGPRGLIASSASTRPGYGQTIRYNGGFTAPDGQHYQAESRPLPRVPEGWRFRHASSWGTVIEKA